MNNETIPAAEQNLQAFAEKWARKYGDPSVSSYELDELPMSEECFALGFVMDCGQRFSEIYGKDAFWNVEAFNRVLSDITDIPLLGSAIHSKWRYYNHWAYSIAELSQPGAREWFVAALNRLAYLANVPE